MRKPALNAKALAADRVASLLSERGGRWRRVINVATLLKSRLMDVLSPWRRSNSAGWHWAGWLMNSEQAEGNCVHNVFYPLQTLDARVSSRNTDAFKLQLRQPVDESIRLMIFKPSPSFRLLESERTTWLSPGILTTNTKSSRRFLHI